MVKYLKALVKLPRVLTLVDKLILTTLVAVILFTSGFWWHSLTMLWPVKPISGGTYTEGIVTKDPYELDLVIAKLTKVGLTYINHNDEIKGALADRWDISPDGKVYIFHLRKGVNAFEVVTYYNSSPSWQNINVSATEGNTVTITLKQPFAPLLAFTSDPVYPAGPFIKDKRTTNEITFTANDEYVLGEPNLQHLILSLYPDERSLKAALQRQEIMGADQELKGVSGTRTKKLSLTKQTVLFFNVEKPFFADKKIRDLIANNQKLDTPASVTLVTSQDAHLLVLANEFSRKAAKLGLTVSIRSLNPIALDRDAVADHNYDMLLADINYGYDQDPYPYWHSSQIIAPGKNYSGYNSKGTDKLIEDARQTLDRNDRKQKYAEIQKILSADTPAIFYPKQEYRYTVSTRLKGVSDGLAAVPTDRFTEVWQWYIKAKREKK